MTVGNSIADAIRAATTALEPVSDTARLDAELLMAHAVGVSRSDLLLNHMHNAEPAQFAALCARRAGHEPIAYILGKTEFYGREFAIRPGVLIPRGDSELLIDMALKTSPHPARILDMGTGSGALLLTLLAEISIKAPPDNAGASRKGSGAECADVEGIGIDASATAIAIARENGLALNTVGETTRSRWSFLQRDWHRPDWAAGLGTFDLILCNPPYIARAAKLPRDVREFEPHEALFAGADGLADYIAILPQLDGLMNRGGAALLEIGHDQAGSVAQLAAKYGWSCVTKQDLGGHDRVLILRRSS